MGVPMQVTVMLFGLRYRVTRRFSVEQYARKMLSEGAWGGGIELWCFSRDFRTNVHVYRVSWRLK